MPQIISVVSKLLGPKDYCQLIMSLLDDHTKSSLLCVIESTADVVPALPVGYLLHLQGSLLKIAAVTPVVIELF